MADSISLSTIRSRLRARGEVDEAYASNSILNDWIQESYHELYDLLVINNPTHNVSSSTANVTSGTNNYAMASDFYRLRGVEILGSDSNWITTYSYPWGARNQSQSAGTVSRRSVRHHLMGTTLYLSPTPNWTTTNGLRVWYTPVAASLANDNSTLDFVNGWESYVVADCLAMYADRKSVV